MAAKFLCEATGRRKCSVDGCEKPYEAKGLCEAHYARMRRHGSPVGGSTHEGDPMAWIIAHVGYIGDDCLIWPFGRSSSGYGCLGVNGKMSRAHRHMLTLREPPPTPMHEAAHSCGKGHLGCCNPKHLAWKTSRENSADKVMHGTANRGERHNMAKLTSENILDAVARARRGEMQKDIAAIYGVGKTTISAIILGKTWSHLTGIIAKS